MTYTANAYQQSPQRITKHLTYRGAIRYRTRHYPLELVRINYIGRTLRDRLVAHGVGAVLGCAIAITIMHFI